jgi:hypothetical protein
VYDWESPELDLFPALLGAREVRVKVGFEARLANRAFAGLARLGPRCGGYLLAGLTPLARVFSHFGHSGGYVKAELFDAGGAVASAAIGAARGGQRMAALPAALVAQALHEDGIPHRGTITAYQALGARQLLDLLAGEGYQLLCSG